MITSLHDRVLHALKACLRPLARVLLRSGVGYKEFSEIAKLAFVEEAIGELDRRGRVKNTSRVAIRTGLSRKEVTRIRKGVLAAARTENESLRIGSCSSYAARVLQLWHVDPAYLSAAGQPKPLLVSGDTESFSSLVKLAGGDVPPGAVRAELLVSGAIKELPEGRLVPLRRCFIPGDVGEDLIVGLTHIMTPVLEGLAHNTGAAKVDKFIQRVAYSDRLSHRAIPLFRQFTELRATAFLAEVDDWLISNESPSSSAIEDTRFSIGVFSYVGPRVIDHGGKARSADKSVVTAAKEDGPGRNAD